MTELDLKIKLNAIIANNSEFTTWTVSTPHLMMLVKQAVEEEREACAQVCEDNATDLSEGDWDSACINCADYIRARGEASLRSTT